MAMFIPEIFSQQITMKKIFILMTLVAFCGCKEGAEEGGGENDLFKTSFRDYRELQVLEGFKKVSDTSIYERRSADNTFRLMELQKGEDHLVLFYKLQDDEDKENDFSFRALDTLWIKELQQNQRITIGYCSKPGVNDGQIIGIVQESDSLLVEISKAWFASTVSGVIEPYDVLEGIECMNEFYQNDKSGISL